MDCLACCQIFRYAGNGFVFRRGYRQRHTFARACGGFGPVMPEKVQVAFESKTVNPVTALMGGIANVARIYAAPPVAMPKTGSLI
ncbi:MAG: hypothetical protein U0Y68_01780 [Blastocatellia bacterium]